MRKILYAVFGLLFLGIVFSITLIPRTDVPSATKTLIHNGYKPIEVGGYDFWNGSKDDFYKTKFTAIAPNGDVVSGCVTKGYWGKGSTIRLND